MIKERINKILSILLFVQIGAVYLLSIFPNFIENKYTNGIYINISTFLRNLFGWIPFSIGDIIYLTLIVLIIQFLHNIIRYKNKKQMALKFLAAFSIFYFCFYFFWGLNYSRLPLTHSLELKKERYDIEKLKVISDKLIFKIKNIHSKLTTNDTLPVVIPYTKNEILLKTKVGYQNLSNDFPQFHYEPTSLKKSLISLPLTYMGFAGYLNPLTGEAQIDYLIPKIGLPMTCSHEIAHQLGIASENEANFIGFLAASQHDDKYFQYAAYLNAFRYVLSDIYRSDKQLYQKYISEIPVGVMKNIKETEMFWKKYQNPFEPIFKIFYDNYLKVNQQKDGIESYNKMVDLIIAYDNKYSLK